MRRVSFVIILFLGSCANNSTVSDGETHKPWMSEEDAFTQRQIVGNYFVEVKYIPIAVMVENAYGVISKDEYARREKEYNAFRYFTVKIGIVSGRSNILKENLAETGLYQLRLDYILKGQDLFKLNSENKSFNCSLYHFERYYNTVPFDKILLGFPQEAFEGSDTRISCVFNDKLLGLGLLTFNFDKTKFVNTTKI